MLQGGRVMEATERRAFLLSLSDDATLMRAWLQSSSTTKRWRVASYIVMQKLCLKLMAKFYSEYHIKLMPDDRGRGRKTLITL